MLKGIDAQLHEIKEMITGMYDQITELGLTSEAVYRTVSGCQSSDPRYVPDGDWDFLDEEE